MSEESKVPDAKQPTEPGKADSAGPKAGSGRVRRQRTEYRNDGAAAKKGLQYVVIPAVVILLLGLVSWLGFKPALAALRQYRGHRSAVLAGQLFADGKVDLAAKTIRTALVLAPDDPVTLGTAARMLESENVPDALTYWRKLFLLKQGTREDHLRYSRLAIRLERYKLAVDDLNELLAANPQDWPAKAALIHALSLAGDFGAAVKHAREMRALEDSFERRFLLGSALVRLPPEQAGENMKLAVEGAELLLNLAVTNNPYQSDAASSLADHTRLTGEAAQKVIAALRQSTNMTLADLTTIAVIQSREDPSKFEQYSKELVKAVASADLPVRLRASSWLTASGAIELSAKLITQQDAATNLTAQLMLLDLSSRLSDFDSIRTTLANTNAALPTVFRVCMEASLATKDGATQKADALFRSAINEAGASSAADTELFYIAQVAERMTNLLVAVAAHEIRLQDSAAVLNASDNILRLVSRGLPLIHSLRALEARHSALPTDLRTASQYYFTAALLGRNLEVVRSGLQDLMAGSPDRPELLLTLALARVRDGESGIGEATKLLEEHPLPEFDTLPLRLRPAYVYVLGQTGRKDLARQLARKLDLSQCYVEERELVEPLLAR